MSAPERVANSILLALTLALFAGACLRAHSPRGIDGEHAALSETLDAQIRAKPGFFGTVLVTVGGETILDRAYGKDASGEPIDPETPFWIASITKQFTAVAVLSLRDRGSLSLDDPIRRFFPLAPSDKSGITIRQLLTHTSGIDNGYAADGLTDRDSAVESILEHPLQSAPGEKFRYAGDNYVLLAAIIEVASDQTYEEFLGRLFDLAKMRKTTFWGAGFDEVAAIDRELEDEITRPNWGYRGATGIASTTGDLRKWVDSLAGGMIISRESVEELLTPRNGIGSDRWHCYGWFTSIDENGDRILWTRGYEDTGHGGYIAADPKWSWLVIVLSSSGAGNGEDGFPLTHQITPELVSILQSGG